ncbi:Branched-chain amino acid ABC transporter, amino acid-binding protein [Archangium gephyra]|uniref:Branched-chain amino acid ABC transporter, amino acid-binding protein n=1 Tax=Archangium gephyra TaxID=48 RepID=A0AAC8Q1L3_9BACT|nr:Branched-chain amino acid ABC transporter, amino acid-binding protein [Archangium gephyra]
MSLLLAGLASLAVGCQPETGTPPPQASGATLKTHEAALATPVGTWTSNASSLVAHAGGHTATLLNGPGNVLVVDGSDAEVYNPYTNAWRRTASPPNAHMLHTATELPSGKVLVMGGHAGTWGEWTSNAELYDPATETWSTTASMLTPRGNHTATLLDSGKVLVLGGNRPIRSEAPEAEVYDPETSTWSSVSAGLLLPRSRTALTVLYSGKVLVTGGYLWAHSGTATSEVHLYDPATNSLSPAGNLARARHGHAALRLYSGNVLIVGGIDGGNTVELYDPYTNQWSLGPPFPYDMTPLFSATMLYSGEVLVTDAIGQAALYDPSTNTWIPTTNMKQGRSSPTATLLHTGEVLMVGGNSGSPRSVERFTR